MGIPFPESHIIVPNVQVMDAICLAGKCISCHQLLHCLLVCLSVYQVVGRSVGVGRPECLSIGRSDCLLVCWSVSRSV